MHDDDGNKVMAWLFEGSLMVMYLAAGMLSIAFAVLLIVGVLGGKC